MRIVLNSIAILVWGILYYCHGIRYIGVGRIRYIGVGRIRYIGVGRIRYIGVGRIRYIGVGRDWVIHHSVGRSETPRTTILVLLS